jgi:hypothetical protein
LSEDIDEILEAFEEDDGTYTISEFAQPVAGVALKREQSVRMNPDRSTQSKAGRSISESEKFVAVFRDEKGRGVAVFIRAKDQSSAMETAKKIEAGISSRLPGGKLARLLGSGNQELWVSPEEMVAKTKREAEERGGKDDKDTKSSTPRNGDGGGITDLPAQKPLTKTGKAITVGAVAGAAASLGGRLISGRLRGFTALKNVFGENTQKFGLIDIFTRRIIGSKLNVPQSAQGTQELKENIHYSPEGAVRHPDVKKLKARIDGLMQQYRTRIIDADRTLDSLIKARTKARRTSGGYRGGPEVRILLLKMVDDAISEVTASSNLAEQQFQAGPQDLKYDILHQVMKQATWLLGRVPEWEDIQDLYALGKLKLTDVDFERLTILKRSGIFEEVWDAIEEYHFQGSSNDLVREALDTVSVIRGFHKDIKGLESESRVLTSMHVKFPSLEHDNIEIDIDRLQQKMMEAENLILHMIGFALKQGWKDAAARIRSIAEPVFTGNL